MRLHNDEIRRCASILLIALLVSLAGCGGGGGGGSSDATAQSTEWVSITSASSSSATANLGGTAWVSKSYYASHCAGLDCLSDTTRTNDYPGVNVTCVNLTTGVSGMATSYYGPGTAWIHKWSASVPVIPGNNTLRISAYDPGGQGGSITVAVVAPLAPLGVQSTFPLAGATKVPVSATISATFNYPVDAQSVTSSSFTVTGPSGDLEGSLSVSDATVSFAPVNSLAYDTVYTATITTAVKGLNGQAQNADYSWTFTAGFTPGEYRGVWGSSGTDVFVVGFGPILHYDGKGWADMTEWDEVSQTGKSPLYHTLFGVWGSSGNDVFAVGDYGTILHYDGSSWSAMASGTASTLVDVWGSSGSDVFAVGSSVSSNGTSAGTILHYDGSAWTQMPPTPAGGLYGVWGIAGTDVFTVGVDTILHYGGNVWTAASPGTSNVQLLGIWGNSGGDVFAVGTSGTILHYDGEAWTAMQPAPTYYMYGAWGTSADDVFAVGASSTILHYDGITWTTMVVPGLYHELLDIWGSSGNDVFAVGSFSGVIFHYNGSDWTSLP